MEKVRIIPTSKWEHKITLEVDGEITNEVNVGIEQEGEKFTVRTFGVDGDTLEPSITFQKMPEARGERSRRAMQWAKSFRQ